MNYEEYYYGHHVDDYKIIQNLNNFQEFLLITLFLELKTLFNKKKNFSFSNLRAIVQK